MVEVSLVTLDLARGRESLRVLDRKEFPVDAAFWYLDDDDEWQFYLHTPLLDDQYPRKLSRKQLYENLRDALA